MTKLEERKEFRALILAEFAEDKMRQSAISSLIRDMQMKAKFYSTIQERWCNEEMTDETTAKVEKREANIEKWFTETLKPFGITPVFSGDPRGSVVKLKVPSGRTNDWGQTGICVPEGN